MGGGPTGTELAQVYARYGVPVTLIDSNPRILARDHARNSALVQAALERDGATVRTGVRAVRVEPRAGAMEAPTGCSLSDGSLRRGPRGHGLHRPGHPLRGPGAGDHRRRAPTAACRVPTSSCASRRTSTSWATRPGRSCTRTWPTTRARWPCASPRGEDVTPDYRAIPRALYTDPEAASVGPAAGAGARSRLRRLRGHAPTWPPRPRATRPQAEGHITIVVDRSLAHPAGSLHRRPRCVRAHPRGRAGDQAAGPPGRSWPTPSTPSPPRPA